MYLWSVGHAPNAIISNVSGLDRILSRSRTCRFLNRSDMRLAGHCTFPEPVTRWAPDAVEGHLQVSAQQWFANSAQITAQAEFEAVHTSVSGKVDLRCCMLQGSGQHGGGGPGGRAELRKHLGCMSQPLPWLAETESGKQASIKEGPDGGPPNESSPPLAGLPWAHPQHGALARKAPEACGPGGAGFFPRKRRMQVLLPCVRNTSLPDRDASGPLEAAGVQLKIGWESSCLKPSRHGEEWKRSFPVTFMLITAPPFTQIVACSVLTLSGMASLFSFLIPFPAGLVKSTR